MAKESVDALVEGGKATAAPPLGPALGPMGVNIGQVVAEINKKTAAFAGMQVPVKVFIDKETKEFDITVGTPPASALIKKEAGIQKGSSNPLTDKVADLRIEQIIKIAKMKQDALLGKTLTERVKEVLGTCQAMGVLVENKPAHDTIMDITNGAFTEEIRLEKTELSAEELKQLEEERKHLQEEVEKRRVEFETKAKALLKELEAATATTAQKRNKLAEAKIPQTIIDQLVPMEKEVSGAAAGAKK